ncbi:MAG TPA: hypothetical protein VNC50_03020 [Planctomycetia bacterium]|nr:hypothetical protein [Planctomycetia bacterium]
MEQALQQFLARLEGIDEDHPGLGDTNVREHMGADVLRGFLRLEPDFVPSGEYGLDPEANRLVARAIGRFVTAATAAAERDGLDTFHKRLAAFQNDDLRTVDGAGYNDFFGVVDESRFDEAGNELP